jgi:glutamyl-tRNA synthetase
MTGRFAPSPTGALHLGNLRTALVAWLAARSRGDAFLVRMEDLDPANSSTAVASQQLDDLRAIGLDWDGDVVHQSERFDLYRDAIARLDAAGLVYPCYCTRREILEATVAPHGEPVPEGAYPGTCRALDARGRSERERSGRRAALRLRAQVDRETVADALAGPFTGAVDDVVLQRNDGVPAYNLAVVVDDALQGVTEVVRGDDLLPSSPRQVHLQRLLGLPTPRYAHVPLVLGTDGTRLAKRHGAVTLAQLADRGRTPRDVCAMLGESLGLCRATEDVRARDLVARFDLTRVPRQPWTVAVEAV